MPQVTEITVSLGLTINLGNYESLRRDVSVTAAAEEGESIGFDVLEQYARSQANYALASALEQDVIARTQIERVQDRREDEIRRYLALNPVFQALEAVSPSRALTMQITFVNSYAKQPAQEGGDTTDNQQ